MPGGENPRQEKASVFQTRERRRRIHRVRSAHGGTPLRPGTQGSEEPRYAATPEPPSDARATQIFVHRVRSAHGGTPLRPGIYFWDSKTSMSRVFIAWGFQKPMPSSMSHSHFQAFIHHSLRVSLGTSVFHVEA